jgi:hypothetical protein
MPACLISICEDSSPVNNVIPEHDGSQFNPADREPLSPTVLGLLYGGRDWDRVAEQKAQGKG